MSEENQLATPDAIKSLVANSQAKYANEKALEVVTKVNDFLPFISLYGSNSKEVKQGKFPMGHFGLRRSKDDIVDLGAECVMFVIAWRPKAMQYNPEPISFYDTESEQFKEIQATADQQDSGKGFGPEFLIWLPGDVKAFATYFLGNKTGRNESPNLVGPLNEDGPFACIQEAILIDPPKSKYSWHGPKTRKYDLDVEMPPVDQFQKELERFNNPPDSAKEVAEKDKEEADDRR